MAFPYGRAFDIYKPLGARRYVTYGVGGLIALWVARMCCARAATNSDVARRKGKRDRIVRRGTSGNSARPMVRTSSKHKRLHMHSVESGSVKGTDTVGAMSANMANMRIDSSGLGAHVDSTAAMSRGAAPVGAPPLFYGVAVARGSAPRERAVLGAGRSRDDSSMPRALAVVGMNRTRSDAEHPGPGELKAAAAGGGGGGPARPRVLNGTSQSFRLESGAAAHAAEASGGFRSSGHAAAAATRAHGGAETGAAHAFAPLAVSAGGVEDIPTDTLEALATPTSEGGGFGVSPRGVENGGVRPGARRSRVAPAGDGGGAVAGAAEGSPSPAALPPPGSSVAPPRRRSPAGGTGAPVSDLGSPAAASSPGGLARRRSPNAAVSGTGGVHPAPEPDAAAAAPNPRKRSPVTGRTAVASPIPAEPAPALAAAAGSEAGAAAPKDRRPSPAARTASPTAV